MKKSTLLALACAALVSSSAMAAVPEVTYVEDPTQGVSFNRFRDNWFITVDGGVNVLFSHADKVLDFGDRLGGAADLQVGKWFSPIMGFRGGLSWMNLKGASCTPNAYGLLLDKGLPEMRDGHYKTSVQNFGLNFDAMINLTNWWCGYKPNRVYNAIIYFGGVGYYGTHNKYKINGDKDGFDWKDRDISLGLRGGIINSFNVSKQVALSLDIRYTALSANQEAYIGYNCFNSDVAAFIGVTYLFNKRTWNAPIVPVIPVIEDCDPIKARLAECEARLSDTQRKLDECLRRPAPEAPKAAPCIAPIATVYYPIGSSNVARVDRNVLKSVAAQMKADTSKKYDVCGWADNYTGSDAVNARLRENRANKVKNILVGYGVNADQLNVTTNPGDRYAGKDNVYLDRCVTIQAQ